MKKDNSNHPWRTGKRKRPTQLENVANAEIPTELLRKAFEKSGLSKSELAERLNWTRPNIDKLNRALGYRPDCIRGKKREIPRQLMSYDLAVRLCKAMGASPFECGV